MNKADKAVKSFKKGYNCAQAVFSTYSEELGLDTETALKIAHGFGAGMGRLQETCGVVTGAFMVLSFKNGSTAANDTVAREKLYGLEREFAQRFEKRNKAITCKKLLEADLTNGNKITNAFKVSTICPKVIRDAVEILEELEQEKTKNEPV